MMSMVRKFSMLVLQYNSDNMGERRYNEAGFIELGRNYLRFGIFVGVLEVTI